MLSVAGDGKSHTRRLTCRAMRAQSSAVCAADAACACKCAGLQNAKAPHWQNTARFATAAPDAAPASSLLLAAHAAPQC
jgi:hypothetical protein